MPRRVMKYNPAFLSPAELIDQFVVRHDDLQMVLQAMRESSTNASRHVLVIGPRGSGKTMLVRRVAAEINRDPQLRDRWYPLIFSEESYQVTTPGEFWLEATFHLGQQTKDPRWQAKYQEYGTQWRDEDAMRERALAQLMAFADQQGRRLLLIVESFNTLLGDQISEDDAWKLRHTLQNEPRVMLLATATSRFEEIDHANKAMYELFRVHDLRPLDRDECRVLWQALTGQLLEGDRVRPVQILTGGNVRLLTILSTFGAQLSLRQLMRDLVGLVDEHTEYFKSHLDALPAVERKVHLALAELWDPSTARDVAAAARLDVNRTSSLLRRLVDRGAVVTLDEPGRTKWYQVAERMYNVYYLFRRRGSPAQRVRAVVRFMISFYQPEQLVTAARRIADEVPGLESSERRDHYQVYCDLLKQVSVDSLRDKLVELARHSFSRLDDIPDALARVIAPPRREGGLPAAVDEAMSCLKELVERLKGLFGGLEKAASHVEEARFVEAEMALRKVVEAHPQFAPGWAMLGQLLDKMLSRSEEAQEAYRKAVEIEPHYVSVWAQLGELLHEELSRFEEAEHAYRNAVEIEPKYAGGFRQFCPLVEEAFSRLDEVTQACREMIEMKPQVAGMLTELGERAHDIRSSLHNLEECYREMIEGKPERAPGWLALGVLLHEDLSRFDDAEEAYRKVIEIDPECAPAWGALGVLLHQELFRFDEAEEACGKALEIDPHVPIARGLMLGLFLRQPERREEALRFADTAIAQSPDDSRLLNSFAWKLYTAGDRSLLERALPWAQDAVALDPKDGRYRHTLASIQCALGNVEDALKTAEKYLADEKTVTDTVNDAVDLFVELPARGEGRRALQVLMDSSSREQLEPLVVGIRIFLGEEVKVAAEIKEIGLDVARRIEQRRDALRTT